MKNKENIFEELNKMRSLIHAKAGTIISEQNDIGYDVATIQAELDDFNTDEQKIVDIVKKYNDKASFKNFLDQYKAKSGKDFGLDIHRGITTNQDGKEVKAITDHLAKLGVGFKLAVKNGKSQYEITGLDAPAALKPEVAKLASDRQKNINNIFCSVKNGIIVNPSSSFNNTSWETWKATYKPTEAELTVAKSSCSSGQRSRQGSVQSGPSVNSRFANSAKSLGVEGGKMDLQTLQTILKNLEGETSTTAAAPTQGTPDIAQLTAALNQLQA